MALQGTLGYVCVLHSSERHGNVVLPQNPPADFQAGGGEAPLCVPVFQTRPMDCREKGGGNKKNGKA
jgi:hypothetical protein